MVDLVYDGNKPVRMFMETKKPLTMHVWKVWLIGGFFWILMDVYGQTQSEI